MSTLATSHATLGANEAPTKLRVWNSANTEEAETAILPCNGSRAWAAGMAARRPIDTAEALGRAADEVWTGLDAADKQQAFDSHPRLGETHAAAATAQSLDWSRGEQSAATANGAAQNGAAENNAARAALANGNRAYEERFGRIFLVCATGKSTAEIIALQQQRMGNDAATEWGIAAEEQRQITQLRLHKWLGLDAVAAEQPAKEVR